MNWRPAAGTPVERPWWRDGRALDVLGSTVGVCVVASLFGAPTWALVLCSGTVAIITKTVLG